MNNMKLLRETIRRLILEDACATLNDKVTQGIETLQSHDLAVSYEKMTNYIHVRVRDAHGAGATLGEIQAVKDPDFGPCSNAYIVQWVRTHPRIRGKGVGAILYDVCFELAGQDGVAADRTSVSDDAFRSWSYFYYSNDYEKKPLDYIDGDFTPDDPSDDCEADAFHQHYEENFDTWDPVWSMPPKDEFQAMPINNVVIKKDQNKPILKCLDKSGLLRSPLP